MKLQKTVILGMSGGVDSSVVALLLQKQGYKVIGIFLKNFSDTKDKYTGECWWREELEMARKIANKLNIPIHMLDYEQSYKNKVIKPMIAGYAAGKTPNPDIDCNNLTKFPALLQAKNKFKADFIATGHYARIKKVENTFQLLQGKDKTKDQSYFLYKLSQAALQHTLFPLGSMKKEEVRQIAQKNHFPNWDKHGSAGVCFIGNVPLRDYLKKHIESKPGKVLDTEGNIIGIHQGASFYTIGQKAGSHIGIIINKPQLQAQKRFYIAQKRGNNLIVAPEGDKILQISKINIINLRVIAPEAPAKKLKARIRHLGQLIPGKLIKKGKTWQFVFNKPQEGIASGQSIVLYKGEQLVSGGEMKI